MHPDRSKMMTAKQAAERAGVSPSLIYQFCDERRLPHFRLGGKSKRGKLMVDPDDLEKFLASCRVEAADDGAAKHT